MSDSLKSKNYLAQTLSAVLHLDAEVFAHGAGQVARPVVDAILRAVAVEQLDAHTREHQRVVGVRLKFVGALDGVLLDIVDDIVAVGVALGTDIGEADIAPLVDIDAHRHLAAARQQVGEILLNILHEVGQAFDELLLDDLGLALPLDRRSGHRGNHLVGVGVDGVEGEGGAGVVAVAVAQHIVIPLGAVVELEDDVGLGRLHQNRLRILGEAVGNVGGAAGVELLQSLLEVVEREVLILKLPLDYREDRAGIAVGQQIFLKVASDAAIARLDGMEPLESLVAGDYHDFGFGLNDGVDIARLVGLHIARGAVGKTLAAAATRRENRGAQRGNDNCTVFHKLKVNPAKIQIFGQPAAM